MAVYLEIYKGGNITKYIETLFNKINYIPKGTVFVKPNLCGRPPIRKAENIDPKFIDALIDLLLALNCKVIIGHTSLLGNIDKEYPFEIIIKNFKTKFLKPHHRVEFMDLDKQNKIIINSGGIDFELPKILYEVDSYINVAKLKTHMQTKVSLTLKNQLGLISVKNRRDVHFLDIDKPIVDLAKILTPKINLIDGIWAMEGNGPYYGRARKTNFIFCGDDMVEIDSFASTMIGFNFKDIDHIRMAEENGIGKFVDQDLIDRYKDKIVNFKPASNFIVKWKRFYVWPNNGCPSCMVALLEAVKWLKKRPWLILEIFIKNKYIDIVYGKCNKPMELKGTKIIGIGRCAERFCRKNDFRCLVSCPPRTKEVIRFLKNNLIK